MDNNAWEFAKNAFYIQADNLKKNGDRLDREAVAAAVDLLAKAPRIAAAGCGHTGIACRHFVHLMCCIERPARFLSPAEALHGGFGYLQPGDVLLLASRGGMTDELLKMIPIAKKKSVHLITVTEKLNSTMALEADVVLPIGVTRETDPENVQGTTSFSVMSTLFDALQAALIVVTGYRKEQFSVIHPGGAVGKRLNELIDGRDK